MYATNFACYINRHVLLHKMAAMHHQDGTQRWLRLIPLRSKELWHCEKVSLMPWTRWNYKSFLKPILYLHQALCHQKRWQALFASPLFWASSCSFWSGETVRIKTQSWISDGYYLFEMPRHDCVFPNDCSRPWHKKLRKHLMCYMSSIYNFATHSQMWNQKFGQGP